MSVSVSSLKAGTVFKPINADTRYVKISGTNKCQAVNLQTFDWDEFEDVFKVTPLPDERVAVVTR